MLQPRNIHRMAHANVQAGTHKTLLLTRSNRNPLRMHTLRIQAPTFRIHAFRNTTTTRAQLNSQPSPKVAIPTNQQQPIIITSQIHWSVIVSISALTIATLAGGFIVSVLYLRPVLKSLEDACDNADKAAKEAEIAAIEITKTMNLIDNELPLTMQEVRKTAEEFELLGKQLNYITGVVARPVEPVGKAAQWVEKAAGTTTSSLSKRLAEDTASLGKSLRSTVSNLSRQFGWLTPDEAKAAARLVDIGRQQQEARSWIASWRSRNGVIAQPDSTPSTSGAVSATDIAAMQKEQDAQDLETMARLGGLLRESMVTKRLALGGDSSVEHDMAVAQVFAALDRAQRAAEEAATSSSVLEEVIQEAERSGLLPTGSVDFDDDDDYSEEDNNGGSGSNGDRTREEYEESPLFDDYYLF